MNFSHVFISRPQREAEELAAMLATLGLQAVTQPAFDYFALDLCESDPAACEELEAATRADLIVFTSPRAVEHGLPQLPREALLRARVLAIGPATAGALAAAGITVEAGPASAYTSEALLESLGPLERIEPGAARTAAAHAFIVAAPGGRDALQQGLAERGWKTCMLMVYRSGPAELDREELAQLEEASAVLSVWTSGNAMEALSRRLPTAIWFRLCQGDWLVISERLQRLARAYGPSRVHLAAGPGNGAILAAIRSLVN